MLRLIVIVAIAATAALAAGCGSDCGELMCGPCECEDAGCDTDADTDSDSDSDSDTDWDCPDPIAEACPDGSGLELPLIFAAADLGEGTRFVDVAPWSVLAERDDGDTRTISVVTCMTPDGWGLSPCTADDAVTATLAVPVDSGLHAVALATDVDHFSEWAPSHLAALCDDTACSLYGAEPLAETPDAALAAIPGGELPANAAIRGLWWGAGGVVCAYGDGIHCFDGSAWTSPIPANPEEPDLNDMATTFFLYDPGVVAVGDSQGIALSGFPDWFFYWSSSYPNWYAVAPYGDGYAAAGDGGLLMLMTAAGWIDDCPFADEAVVELRTLDESWMEWSMNRTFGATASGRVFVADGPPTAMANAC